MGCRCRPRSGTSLGVLPTEPHQIAFVVGFGERWTCNPSPVPHWKAWPFRLPSVTLSRSHFSLSRIACRLSFFGAMTTMPAWSGNLCRSVWKNRDRSSGTRHGPFWLRLIKRHRCSPPIPFLWSRSTHALRLRGMRRQPSGSSRRERTSSNRLIRCFLIVCQRTRKFESRIYVFA